MRINFLSFQVRPDFSCLVLRQLYKIIVVLFFLEILSLLSCHNLNFLSLSVFYVHLEVRVQIPIQAFLAVALSRAKVWWSNSFILLHISNTRILVLSSIITIINLYLVLLWTYEFLHVYFRVKVLKRRKRLQKKRIGRRILKNTKIPDQEVGAVLFFIHLSLKQDLLHTFIL